MCTRDDVGQDVMSGKSWQKIENAVCYAMLKIEHQHNWGGFTLSLKNSFKSISSWSLNQKNKNLTTCNCVVRDAIEQSIAFRRFVTFIYTISITKQCTDNPQIMDKNTKNGNGCP